MLYLLNKAPSKFWQNRAKCSFLKHFGHSITGITYASTKAQSQRLSAQLIAEEMKSFDVSNLKHNLFSYKIQTTKHSGVKFLHISQKYYKFREEKTI